jgi:AcrR family transcriptional regulator
MSVTPIRDRRSERREATRAEILEAAWAVAREEGLAGITLRGLGLRVGMRAQSLYSYFDSKDAIYDAMFRQGNEQLLARFEALARDPAPADPVERLRSGSRAFVEFALDDLPRTQLLFLRVIPGFEPSPEAYAPAIQVLELTRTGLAAVGITSVELVDLHTAVIGGLIAQQTANDPGGDRWARLLDDALDMYLAYARSREKKGTTKS